MNEQTLAGQQEKINTESKGIAIEAQTWSKQQGKINAMAKFIMYEMVAMIIMSALLVGITLWGLNW